MLRVFLAVILTVATLFATPLLAQDQPQLPDYDRWNEIASRAEDLIDDREITNETLAATRDSIVEWRGQFQGAQNVNADRIDTVRQQIEALGPAPAEGAPAEGGDIANRRKQLNEQLSTLEAPRLTAVEALSRANSVIGNIDRIRDMRQAQELARVSPSPLLPSSWALAVTNGLQLAEGMAKEAAPDDAAGRTWADLRPRMPMVAAYLLAALALLTYGRAWIGGLPSRLSARASDYSRAVVAFVSSLGQIALPMIGVYLLIRAIKATGLPGPWTTPVLTAVPVAAVMLFGGTWLGRTLFPRQAIAYETLQMDDRDREAARRLVISLSVVIAIQHIIAVAILPQSGLYQRLGDEVQRVPLDFAEGAASVWHFVMILAAGYLLFRLGRRLRRLTQGPDAGSLPYRNHILAWGGRLSQLVAVLSVVLAGFGLVNLGNLFIWPGMMTLALVGLLILLQDFTADLFNMIKRGQEGARDGLAPLLIGFTLVLLSVPLFMVIWGARSEELAEYWTRFQNGASLGGIRLSPVSVLTFLIVFGIGYTVTRGMQGAFRNSILPKTRLDAGGQNAVVSGLGYVGIVLAALLAITSAGINLSSLAIVAGALSVGIGFGLQNIVSNFVSGIILLIERPVGVGDWISAGGQQGIVKKISVRSTMVETFDKTEVIVPNSDLISQPVTNWTRHNKIGRIIVPVGVAYGTDTRKVERILRQIVEDHPLVTVDPAPAVLFRALGAGSMEFEIRAILSDVGAGIGVTSDLLHQIVDRFNAEDIEIPFAPRDDSLRIAKAEQAAADRATPDAEADLTGENRVRGGKHASQPMTGADEHDAPQAEPDQDPSR